MAILTAAVGGLLFILGLLSATYPPVDFYQDALAGCDPPFDAVAGLLLLAVSFRVRDRSPVAWIFAILAPGLTVSIAVLSPNVFSIAAGAAATILVALLYPNRVGFYRGSATGPEATQLLVVVAALVTGLFGVVGSRLLAGQFLPPPGIPGGWVESLYYTIATVSTNGTNFTPATVQARLFTTLLILFGVGTFLSAVVVLFLPFLEQRLERIANRLERSQMEEITDHVIICGTSPEGRATADELSDHGVRSILLSLDAPVIDRLRTEGYRTHLGDPSSEEDLQAVGVTRARALVAAGESDAENLLTVITARGMQPRLRIVAVGSGAPSLAKLRRAGADEAISLVTVGARLVSAAALETRAGGGAPGPTISR
ncbi:MAG: NAD-binding protein [Thermoplasmata archaeon]